jgi:hypothetical protein
MLPVVLPDPRPALWNCKLKALNAEYAEIAKKDIHKNLGDLRVLGVRWSC